MHKYLRKPPDQWRPLFYRILQNKIRDWQRKNAVRQRLHVPSGDNECTSAFMEQQAESLQTGPEQQYAQDITMQRLQLALERLSCRQRQTFLLRVWEGFDVAETARIMGCSSGSVKTHLSRAMRTLQELLQQYR